MKSLRIWIIGALSAGCCFIMGALIASELPKAEAWVRVTIEKLSRDQLPVHILPGKIEIAFLPLGVRVNDVKITPKDDLKAVLKPFDIGSVYAQVSLWQLMQGKLRIATLKIDRVRLQIQLPEKQAKSAEPPLAGLFKIANQVPIRRAELTHAEVDVSQGPYPLLSVRDLELDADRDLNLLTLELRKATIQHKAESADVALRAQLTPKHVDINSLLIRSGQSFVAAALQFAGDTEKLAFNEVDGSARADLDIATLREAGLRLRDEARASSGAANESVPEKAFPQLFGRARINVTAAHSSIQEPELSFHVETDDFKVLKIFLGHIAFDGRLHSGSAKINRLSLQNKALNAGIANLLISTKDHAALSGLLEIPATDLHELMKVLEIGDLPVYATFRAQLPCKGQLAPLSIQCSGSTDASNMVVKAAATDDKPIVAVRAAHLQGELAIDPEKVSYSSEISMNDSKGRSHGEIGFETGFKIGYEADRLSMQDIASLVGLKLEGVFKIKGTTEGDAQHGRAAMTLEGSNVWFEDYSLGATKSNVSYRDGQVRFDQIQGFYTVSRYEGDVAVDVVKKSMVVNARVPFFDTKDLIGALARKMQLPFAVTGTGQAQIQLTGPLQPNLLTYDLKSSIYHGNVAGETFDQATFNIRSVKGEVSTEKVVVQKNKAAITLQGGAHPDGSIKAVALGRGLHVEDTAAVASSGLALSGVVDFDMDLGGHILAPETDMRGVLSKTAVGDQSVPDSQFRLKFNKKSLEGSGQFFGNKITSEFIYPYQVDSPFRLKLKTHSWSFAPILSALTGPNARKDYQGTVSADINLSAPTGGFWNSSGTARLDELSLSRGTLALSASSPLLLSMKNGQLHIENFQMSGNNTFLKLTENPNPVSKVDIQANGKLDLNLMAWLTPFLEDLRGTLAFAFNVRLNEIRQTEILGSASLDRGYLKFFEFPHPIENIRAEAAFNQNKILFNSLKSEIGGGKVSGSGTMELRGYKDYPVNVALQFDKISLNVPDQIKTTGSGQMTITGHWFPFQLAGQYTVVDGLMTKEFANDGAKPQGDGSIRRDNYLPDFLVAENFVPLLVDLKIAMPTGLAVKNEMMDGRVLGDLRVHGNPSKAAISGTITTDNQTKITFRDTIFDVVSAHVEFTDSVEINPKLYLSARARVQEYDVNILVQGNAQKPEISLSSVPLLTEKDIVSLLALGATDSQLDKTITSKDQGASTVGQVGTGVLKKNPISNALKDKLGVDVQFAPGFDDSNNSVEKVIVSRQFSKKLDASASRSFGKATTTEAKVRYRLNDRFSLIGSWLGKDSTDTTDPTQTDVNPNQLGVDIEYKFEFK